MATRRVVPRGQHSPDAALSGPLAAPGPGGRCYPAVRLRLDLSYDGSGFHGWAASPGLRTVQQVARGRARPAAGPARAALALTVAGPDRRRGARARPGRPRGRAAELLGARPAAPRSGGWPACCRPTSGCGRSARAPDGFDARFSALWRRYSYRVCDDPAARGPAAPARHPVAPAPARHRPDERGGPGLPGRARLRRLLPPPGGRHHGPRAAPAGVGAARSPALAVATVVADAFCHNMVRALAGAPAGGGRGPPAARLARRGAHRRGPRPGRARRRRRTALCLEEVRYPPDAELGGPRRAHPPSSPGACAPARRLMARSRLCQRATSGLPGAGPGSQGGRFAQLRSGLCLMTPHRPARRPAVRRPRASAPDTGRDHRLGRGDDQPHRGHDERLDRGGADRQGQLHDDHAALGRPGLRRGRRVPGPRARAGRVPERGVRAAAGQPSGPPGRPGRCRPMGCWPGCSRPRRSRRRWWT